MLSQTTNFFVFQNLNVKLSYPENNEEIATFDINYPSHLEKPEIVDVTCKRSRRNEPVCRILISTENGATILLQSGKMFIKTNEFLLYFIIFMKCWTNL